VTLFAILLGCAPAVAAASLPAAQDDAFTRIEIRVTTTTPGSLVVDRGTTDGVLRGDRVVLRPRGTAEVEGFVEEALERVSRVELAEGSTVVPVGTRGEILVPNVRLRRGESSGTRRGEPASGSEPSSGRPSTTKTPEPEKKPATTRKKKPAAKKPATEAATEGGEPAPKPANAAADPAKGSTGTTTKSPTSPAKKSTRPATSKSADPKSAKPSEPGAKPSGAARSAGASEPAPAHPGWQRKEEAWSKDKPLLSQLKPLRPEERAFQVTGRVWALVDVQEYEEANDSNNVYRVGAAFDAENPFGQGGALHFDAEMNQRYETSGGSGNDLLTRRLSYSWGGTRFDPMRWEVGRFLQHGMPEFGFLDGLEWSYRTSGGDRLGASVGYAPEPDDDFDSFDDLQFAAYYRWCADESERFTATAGYQKLLHDEASDRDLVVAKLRYVPGGGWDFHAAAWLDFYGSGDRAKENDYELTQAVCSLGRRYDDGDWWNLTYRKVSFPDIDRTGEFTPITRSVLDHNRLHRVMLSGSSNWTRSTRVHGRAGGWVDEEESGGTGEAGIEFPGFFLEDSTLDFTGFGTLGQFTSVVGGRVSYGGFVKHGRWDLFYEIANHHHDGFMTDIEDDVQHRVHASRSFYFPSGWTISAQGGVFVIDEDLGWSFGLFVQKSF